jgi:hypothetical protein
MATPRPSLLDLHPVEALLALLLISVAAIARLLRPQVGADWKRQPLVRVTGIQPQASAAPRRPTVAELRRMVRARGLSQVGGRPIHKARRADLVTAALGL